MIPFDILLNDLFFHILEIIKFAQFEAIKQKAFKFLCYTPATTNGLNNIISQFISYKEKLKVEEDRFGFIDYVNYDACFCGPDILDIAHTIEKYSHLDISHIRKGMKEKVRWLKKNEPDFYETCFHGNDKDFLKKIDSKR